MAGKVLQLDEILIKDDLGCAIANQWMEWDMLRAVWKNERLELNKYLFATDTTETSNASLPWKNKTTIPKLTQIRDNLYANYMRTLFPKRKWMTWEAYDKMSNTRDKREAIEAYMCHVVDRSDFQTEVGKLILDWIDYGNCFAMPEWRDSRIEQENKDQVGYVGPGIRRINPMDIVFNPIAEHISKSPIIIRSLVSMGEVKKQLEQIITEDNRESLDALWTYLRQYRQTASQFPGEVAVKDTMFNIDGFTSFQAYLKSNYCEILTFYGDIYDFQNDEFLQNHIVTVVDRHKIIDKRPNDSIFGQPQIYHVGWRVRQDNLWAMGPLDNLVGMQYRLDHIENLKADLFDLTAFPPIHIKGIVEDFEWGPFARIYSDVEGEVKPLWDGAVSQALQANLELGNLIQTMEEMAGAPKEAMGFRTPGEKTMYEVQRLENAAGRIFQSKTEMFEMEIIEPSLSGMLELAKRKLPPSEIAVLDDEYKTTFFLELSAADITGNGRIKPIAARHFAEKAEKVQNVTNWFNSPVGQDPQVLVHISGIAMAKMMEDLLDLEGYQLVQENVRLQEQADTQRLANAQSEDIQMEAQTPSGLTPDDIPQ